MFIRRYIRQNIRQRYIEDSHILWIIHLIIYVFAFFRWVVSSWKPYISHTLLMILCKNMLESFSFRPWALDLLPVKCSYVMVDCSFSLALCTENKWFSTIYYVLVGYENLGIPLSDTGKSMVKKKPEGHPLIIKLLLSLWLLYKNYMNYYMATGQWSLSLLVICNEHCYTNKKMTYNDVCYWTSFITPYTCTIISNWYYLWMVHLTKSTEA